MRRSLLIAECLGAYHRPPRDTNTLQMAISISAEFITAMLRLGEMTTPRRRAYTPYENAGVYGFDSLIPKAFSYSCKVSSAQL